LSRHPDERRLMTTQQAAEAFHVEVQTLRTWRARAWEDGIVLSPNPGWWWEDAVAQYEAATRRAPRRRKLAQLAKEETA